MIDSGRHMEWLQVGGMFIPRVQRIPCQVFNVIQTREEQVPQGAELRWFPYSISYTTMPSRRKDLMGWKLIPGKGYPGMIYDRRGYELLHPRATGTRDLAIIVLSRGGIECVVRDFTVQGQAIAAGTYGRTRFIRGVLLARSAVISNRGAP